jgi:2-iminobutanoate/2-iminopropanoate deaminase
MFGSGSRIGVPPLYKAKRTLSLSHHRETVTAVGAPAAVGPYSHAVKSNGLLFCSGQIPLDADSGELVGETAAEQATKCLENLQAVAAAAGATLADAVRCTVYLLEMGDFAEVNAAYEQFFPYEPPARVAFGVAALPKNARVEIDAVIALPD